MSKDKAIKLAVAEVGYVEGKITRTNSLRSLAMLIINHGVILL
jgi:hypothetical protein